MQVHERRRLLASIETLVKHPGKADIEMMSTVLADLGALYSEYCGREVTFLAVCAKVPGNQEQLEGFKKSLTRTKQEQGG